MATTTAGIGTPPTEGTKPALPAQLGWATGAIGSGLILNVQGTMFLFFLSRVLEIPVRTAGLLLLAAKLYDVVINPLLGAISDRTNGRWGRRRPYLLAGAAVAGPAIAFFFSLDPAWGAPPLLALAGLMAIATGYTLFNVPFLAIPGEIGLSYHGRTKLMTFRNLFNTVGLFLGMVLAPLVLSAAGDQAAGYRQMGFAVGAIISLAMLIAFVASRGLPFETHVPQRLEKGAYREVLTSRGFRPLLVAKFAALMSTALGQAALLFMITDVLRQSPRMLAVYGSSVIAANLASLPFWNWLSRRSDKRAALLIAWTGVGIGHTSWLLAVPGEPSIYYVARGLFTGVFVGGGLVLAYSMLPDVMTLHRHTTGKRREGAFAGVYSMAEKIAFAAAPALLALVLGGSGGTRPDPETIRYTLALGPGIGYALAFAATWFYSIREETLADAIAAS